MSQENESSVELPAKKTFTKGASTPNIGKKKDNDNDKNKGQAITPENEFDITNL